MLDVNLRGELVTPVAVELRAQDVPFVLASAYDSPRLAAVAPFAGAFNVRKPIDERRLLFALAQAVGNRLAAMRGPLPVSAGAALACVLPVAALLAVAEALGLGIDAPWTFTMMVADGQIGLLTMVAAAFLAGTLIALVALAFRRRGSRAPADAQESSTDV